MQASKTKKNNGWRSRETDEKFENALKRRQNWRETKRTRNGGASHVYLALLAVLATRTPYPVSLCDLTPFVLLILSSHFTAIAIALPGVGFQSNPRDPCGKVWLFNFLPRGVRQLSPSFFLSSHLSELLAFAILSASLSHLPSLMLRGAVHFFSARSDRSFQDLYIVPVRGNFTWEEKICRV